MFENKRVEFWFFHLDYILFFQTRTYKHEKFN